MFDKYFPLIFDFIKNRKRPVLAVVCVLAVAAAAGLGLLDFNSSIELMLPDKDNIHRTISFLRDSNLTDKVIVSLSLTDTDRVKRDLINAVEKLEDSLKPPLFTKIVSGVSEAEVMDSLFAPDYFPQIATEKDLQDIDSRINAGYVSMRMKEIYRQMLRPQSIFTAPMFYADPLGIKSLLLEKMKAQSFFTDYKVKIEAGHFISSEGRHAMIIVHTPVPVTDSAGSKELIDTLRNKINQLPDYISADIISGHLHTLSNEKVIKRDIRLTISIATAAFLLLFLFAFRDARAALVFLIPVLSVILSMNLSSLIIGNLSYWVVGLGTVIAGIAVDYGIHIFVTVRNSGNDTSIIRHVAKPVSIGAITTMGIFTAFFFSDIEGYHQLALFSILSIAFSLLLALLLLPHLLSAKGRPFISRQEPGNKGSAGPFDKVAVVIWIVMLIVSLFLSFSVTFDSDIAKLDGSEPEIFRAEENFRKIWGGKDTQAVFVVTGRDYEDALERNDEIYQKAVEAMGAGNFSSLSVFWPSTKTREKNIARWNEFWQQGREAKLRRLIKEEGEKYQIIDSAFSPFFDNLYVSLPSGESPHSGFLSGLEKRFVQKGQDGYQVLSFFPDKKEFVAKLSELAGENAGTFIVSRRALSESISESLASEVKLFSVIATIFIVLLTVLLLQDLKKSMLALIPVITNVLLLLGFMSLAGLSLNIANLIAGIVAMGLCIDYGIFMTYGYVHELKRSAAVAVTISAVTTLIGAGVLIFARHPALFSIGITMVIGVMAGYVSSIIIIPALEKIISTSSGQR